MGKKKKEGAMEANEEQEGLLMQRFELIQMDLVKCDQNQPRRQFNEETIRELADSIEQEGLLQPIIVKPTATHESDGMYVIVAGERRYRAFVLLKRNKIPAIIRNRGDTFALSLVENILRENLNQIDEAKAVQKLIRNMGYTQEQVATLVKKSTGWVQQRLLLLRLPKEVQDMITNGKLPPVQGLNLARYKGPKGTIIRLAHDLSAARLSGQRALRAIRSALGVDKDCSDEDLLLGIQDVKTKGMDEDEKELATEQRGQTITVFSTLYTYLKKTRNALARLDKIPAGERGEYFKIIPERTRSKLMMCALEAAQDMSLLFDLAKTTGTDVYAATQYEELVKKLSTDRTDEMRKAGGAGQMKTVPEWLLAPWAMLLHPNGPTRSTKEIVGRSGITANSLPGFMNGALAVIASAWEGKENDTPEVVDFCAKVRERFSEQADLLEIIKGIPTGDDPLDIEMIQ